MPLPIYREAICGRCRETFVPADEYDLVHIEREDGVECGGDAATYHGIVRARCLPCGYDTTDTLTLEVWNDIGGDCPSCSAGHVEWHMLDGTTPITRNYHSVD